MTDERDEFPYPLVTTGWLAETLGQDDLKIIDASWRMPGNPPAIEDRIKRRIKGAVFFDLDEIADKSAGLPHMLPAAEDFARAIGSLGIKTSDRIVVYDDAGLFSAARVWWTFRAMGHSRVSVLDGGLPKWLREGRPVDAGGEKARRTTYRLTELQRPMARTASDVLLALKTGGAVVLDARPASRFTGDAVEPRAGIRSGHMPGAINLPFPLLLKENGELKPLDALASLFRERGVHMGTRVITTCGSGVTAAILCLALERLGHTSHALYDGSWTEWGDQSNDPSLYPVVTG